SRPSPPTTPAASSPERRTGAKRRAPDGPRVLSTREEDRAGAVPEHVLGRAPEHHLDDARVAVGADEEEVVIVRTDEFDDALVRMAANRLERHRQVVGVEIAPGLVEHAPVAAVLARDV